MPGRGRPSGRKRKMETRNQKESEGKKTTTSKNREAATEQDEQLVLLEPETQPGNVVDFEKIISKSLSLPANEQEPVDPVS